MSSVSCHSQNTDDTDATMPDPEEGELAGGQAENGSNVDAVKWCGRLRWSSRSVSSVSCHSQNTDDTDATMPDPEEGELADGQAENGSNGDAVKWCGRLRWSSRSASSVSCHSQNTDDTDATVLDPEEGELADGQAENGSNVDAVKWCGRLRWSSRSASSVSCHSQNTDDTDATMLAELADGQADNGSKVDAATCGWPGGERKQRRRSEMVRPPQMVEPERELSQLPLPEH